MITAPFRRIVTGHDASGRSTIIEDRPPPRAVRIDDHLGVVLYEVWNTRETPARIDRASGEPPEEGVILAPPKQGTRIRILEVPPESGDTKELTPEQARAHFAQLGAADAHSGSRHHSMHRTQTIDYGIVLEGEITLLLDEEETVVRAGDIVIQRGTNHGWVNRSNTTCRIAFILIDGEFTEDLR